MKVELSDLNLEALTPAEVAEQMTNSTIETDEEIGAVSLEDGDLVVEIRKVVKGDPRCTQINDRYMTFDIEDIRAEVAGGDKHLRWFECDIVDEEGDVVARVRKRLYFRKSKPKSGSKSKPESKPKSKPEPKGR